MTVLFSEASHPTKRLPLSTLVQARKEYFEKRLEYLLRRHG